MPAPATAATIRSLAPRTLEPGKGVEARLREITMTTLSNRKKTATERHLYSLKQRQATLVDANMHDMRMFMAGQLAPREYLTRVMRRTSEQERLEHAIFFQSCTVEELWTATSP